MYWSDQQTAEIEERFKTFSPQRAAELDARALMLFCHVQMLGLGDKELPGSAPYLDRDQVAKFRMLALLTETTLHPLPQHHPRS